MIGTVGRLITSLAIGAVLFAALLLLHAEQDVLVALPVGVAALWYLGESARSARRKR